MLSKRQNIAFALRRVSTTWFALQGREFSFNQNFQFLCPTFESFSTARAREFASAFLTSANQTQTWFPIGLGKRKPMKSSQHISRVNPILDKHETVYWDFAQIK